MARTRITGASSGFGALRPAEACTPEQFLGRIELSDLLHPAV